jgi:hypothetical protein
MGCVLLAASQETFFLRLVVGQTPIFVSQPDAKENIRELFECFDEDKEKRIATPPIKVEYDLARSHA